jgi:addiction module RelE/StbE family toxin
MGGKCLVVYAENMDIEHYKLELMPSASVDLDNIFNYISDTLVSPKAAHNLMNRIEGTLLSLEDFPQLGPKCSDKSLSARGYRKLLIKNYLAFYKIDEEQKRVLVMRIIYARRNYERLV